MATTIEPLQSDPIIAWPANVKLRPILSELQRLNPGIGLRCAMDHDHDCEYLVYDGSALNVVTLAMPEPPNDELLGGLTRANRDWDTVTRGGLQSGPRRFERTAHGELLIRPWSWAVAIAFQRFALGYQGLRSNSRSLTDEYPLDQIGRIQGHWGIFREPSEVWEVEFAYLPARHFYRADGTRKDDREWWSTIPIGTISYIDEFDLPIEVHYARARAIVAIGARFAVVGDLKNGGARLFRPSGVQSIHEDMRIPEMTWFDIPIPQGGDREA